MKLTTNKMYVKNNPSTGEWGVFIQIPESSVNDIHKLAQNKKPKSVEIKIKREGRSLTANSYYWTLLHQLAVINRISDDEAHEMMLRRYGTKKYLVTVEEAEPMLKRAYKFVDRLKETVINDTKGYTFRCIRGSSTYDTKEMSVLIEGLVSECNNLGISTMTPEELEKLIERYGEENV